MLHLFRKPSLFAPAGRQLGYLAKELTYGNDITVESITQVPDNNARIRLTFESSFGCFVGAGLRITIAVTNEVQLLCTGIEQYERVDSAENFQVSFSNGKRRREVTGTLSNGESYHITCKQVIIESHERYCCDENGNKTPLDQALQQYKESGPQLREWLNELKKKRDAERARQQENN